MSDVWNMVATVNFLNIRTPKKFVVMTLKFELCGSTIESKRCRRNGKQCRPWSDCSSRSSLIWVCTVCPDLYFYCFAFQLRKILHVSRAMRKCVLCHMRTTKAPPGSLINAFVVRCLDSIISLDSISEISRLQLASVAAQAGLCLAWSETPKDTLSFVVAHIQTSIKVLHILSLCCTTKPTKWPMRPAKTPISPVWSIFAVCWMGSLRPKVSSCGQRTWSESLLGAHIILLVLSCTGLIYLMLYFRVIVDKYWAATLFCIKTLYFRISNILDIQKYAVITLKVEQDGFTLE